ncbi:MAG: preprotein translocase subunit SecY [Anaerolineae bacterium]|jgi:preprotein translocase subunit SecY|nr:preprotein translocase subunit SecY [Anaerolineae bacterium]
MKSTFSGWHYLWKSEDIRRKLVITLILLVIFRIAANVPAPGVDQEILKAFRASASGSGGFLDFLNLLSGGTISNFSLLSMGVYPYITAQIILQLLIPIIPSLQKRIQDDPREGRRWQEKWTYYLSVPMAALSAIGQINLFNSFTLSTPGIERKVLEFGLFDAETALVSWSVLVAMTAGTMFAIWLGELISEYGIRGQGLSLIIFAGIVAQIPGNFATLLADESSRWIMLALTVFIIVLTVIAIVYVQQGRRNVPVMYPGRRVGNRMSMPVKGTMPLMVNLSGMIPLIFASAILQFPAIIASFFVNSENQAIADFFLGVQNFFGATGTSNWGYWTIYFLMVVVFTFFYTTVMFDQQNYGENLKKVGASVPGVLTGAPTQKYLSTVQSRITLVGAVFLGVVAIMPFLLGLILAAFNISASNNTGIFLITSSGLLIVVGVVRDTFQNIDAELKLHGYQDSLLVR